MQMLFELLLTPPGEGVLTIHTQKRRKEKLQQILYKEDIKNIRKSHLESLSNLKKICLLGVCSDCGGGIQRGANWGPLFLRLNWLKNNSELFEDKITDLGDIPVIPHLLVDDMLNSKTIAKCQEALYKKDDPSYLDYAIKNNLPVSPLSITGCFLSSFYEKYSNNKVISLGGDHSVSYPLVKALLNSKSKNHKIAVIHFDAHTDLLDKRFGVDINFGSWAYHILSDLCDPSALVQIGIRSTGKDRDTWESNLGVKQFWASEIKKVGLEKIISQIKEHLKALDIDALYFSVDIDVLDKSEVSATGTPEPDGLFVKDVCNIILALGKEYEVLGADLVEVAPMIGEMDENNTDDFLFDINNSEPQRTLDCGVKILNSLVDVM